MIDLTAIVADKLPGGAAAAPAALPADAVTTVNAEGQDRFKVPAAKPCNTNHDKDHDNNNNSNNRFILILIIHVNTHNECFKVPAAKPYPPQAPTLPKAAAAPAAAAAAPASGGNHRWNGKPRPQPQKFSQLVFLMKLS